MRKRLHMPSLRHPGRGFCPWPAAATLSLLLLVFSACDESENPLADYEGARPLIVQRVTQSATPDLQWVGGRVAAVGVNLGEEAGLDETLVWLQTESGNAINSHVTINNEVDEAAVRSFGGTPVDKLEDGKTYTFWLAERSMLDAGLNPGAFDGFNFVDTTVTMKLTLAGRQRGLLPVTMTITREETLLGERFIIDWTPSTTPVRRIAVRKGAASAGFTDLAWHVLLEDEAPDGILPPVEIGKLPPGAIQAAAWPESGFTPDPYTVWMVNSDWQGNFGLNPAGMAYFVLFATNF